MFGALLSELRGTGSTHVQQISTFKEQFVAKVLQTPIKANFVNSDRSRVSREGRQLLEV